MFHQLEKFYFSRNEIRNFCPDVFELDVVTPTVNFTIRQGPSSIAVLWFVFELAVRDKKLETIRLLVAKLHTYLISSQIECLADGLA